jgi:NitT/TauT family transport system substrate-binding protein
MALAVAGCSKPPAKPSETAATAAAPKDLVKLRMTIDADAMLPRLAGSLGYFKDEGIEIEEVDIHAIAEHDFLMQQPLIEGKVDASYHWFQHTVFGARHSTPIKAVILFADSPGLTVMAANRVKDKIKRARDFRGRRIAQGGGHATKAMLMNYLAVKDGLPQKNSYQAIATEAAGREDAVLAALRADEVDVMAFMEPTTAALQATGLVTTLYDMTSREATEKVFGAALPADCLLMAPEYIAKNPEVVQRVVNAFVRTMRYVNSHSAEEIVAALPASYLANKDKVAETERIRNTLRGYAQGDYTFHDDDVKLIVDTIMAYSFNDTPAGKYRAGGENTGFVRDSLYTNEFVSRAMAEIR